MIDHVGRFDSSKFGVIPTYFFTSGLNPIEEGKDLLMHSLMRNCKNYDDPRSKGAQFSISFLEKDGESIIIKVIGYKSWNTDSCVSSDFYSVNEKKITKLSEQKTIRADERHFIELVLNHRNACKSLEDFINSRIELEPALLTLY